MSPGAVASDLPSNPATSDWTRALFDAVDDAVLVHDASGNILEANPAACRRLGYSHAEMLRLTTRDIDDFDFSAGFADRWQAQFQHGCFRFEGRHRTKEGRVIPVDINTSTIRFDDKPAVLAVIRDISQRKETEEKLAQRTDLLRSILNNMSDAVLVAGSGLEFLGCNPAAERLFGLHDTPQSRGQPLPPLSLFLPDKITPVAPGHGPLERSIRGEEIDEIEFFARPAGAARGVWLSTTASPLRDDRGQVMGGVLVCRNVTERKRATGRLAAQHAIARVLSEGVAIEGSARTILKVMCESFGLDVGVLWLVNPRERCLACLETWKQPALDVPRFLEATRGIAIDAGQDAPGQAWSQKGPVTFRLHEDGVRLPLRLDLARQEQLGVSYAFPIRGSEEIIGIIEFLSRAVDAAEEDFPVMMKAVGSQIGLVVERQRFETALRDSQALYHSLVQLLPQNIFRKDRAGHITFANQHFCDTVKKPLHQLLGKTDFDLFPADLAAKYVADDRRVMNTGIPYETIENHLLPDGTTIHVQVVKTPVYDAEGQITGIQGIFWDVTERVRAELVLAESEFRYRQLTEATLDGIVLADQDSVITLFNPAAERMFGYQADEIIGQKTEILVPPNLRAQHRLGFARYVATREPHIIGRTLELSAVRKDGTEIPVEVALSALPLGRPAGPDGHEPIQFLAAFRDLTERNKMRAVLVQNEKLASIGLLSAGVAHEINNPLAFVANNLAVLERDSKECLALLDLYKVAKDKLASADPELLAKINTREEEIDLAYMHDNLGPLLRRTRDGVERVTRIVQSLRGLARTDPPRRQQIRLPDLIDGSLEILHGRFKRSKIDIEQDHDPEPRLSGVPTQINQVILNLLINAFQAVESHRKQGGLVRIKTRRRQGEMLIEIADNGPGIAPDHLDKVFDPFFTTKDVGEGTGLGLSITHNIVTAHGGRIEVDSQPGQGACFRVFLPLGS